VWIFEQELVHPTQPRVRLRVARHTPEAHPAVAGLGPDRPGFLLTEERLGTAAVFKTLGLFPVEKDAVGRAHARVRELLAQRYAIATSAA
jgi:hypothetical protein